MTKAQARAWCRAQKKIIAAWAKEQRLRRLEALKQEVAAKKKRSDEECKRKVAGAKAKPKKKVRKAVPKKKAAKKRAAPRPRKKAVRKAPPRPRKKAAKPKARKRAPKRKAARKKAKKATSARGAPARVAEKVRAAYAQLRARDGLRNVSVSELRRVSGVTRAQLHAFLQEQLAQRMANPSRGEPTAVGPGVLADALPVGGTPHLLIELYDVPEVARPAPVDRDAGKLAYAYAIERVRDAVRSKSVKRFGEKVFIGSVWKALQRREPFKSMSRAEFDRLLLHAHREGDLRMSRADLVSAMNRKDVDESEIAYLNATFHFLNPEESAVVPVAPYRRPAEDDRFAAAFGRAFNKLVRNTRSGLVPLSDMRAALPAYSREKFESSLRGMRLESDEYALEAFDGRHGTLPREWADGAVREGGRVYIFVKRRDRD